MPAHVDDLCLRQCELDEAGVDEVFRVLVHEKKPAGWLDREAKGEEAC